ncbi:response regulator [Sphingomonas bacterium]|uniref:response regulator n=1 Tax=Sphingomonas bacterium TaxID=1895847 RepID=UPI0020C72EA5|nr:response regulator [Sphingomonas bacterium]
MLIIEDEWLIAEYIEQLARDAGATSVDTADCQYGAIEAAANHAPEIILSDVNLKTGTGPRAVAAIQAKLGPIPVIFITGTPEDCIPCAPPGIVLTKPIQAEVLVEAFRRLAPVG